MKLTLDDLINAKRLLNKPPPVRKEAPIMLSKQQADFLRNELGDDWVRKAKKMWKGMHPTGFFTDIVIYVDEELVLERGE